MKIELVGLGKIVAGVLYLLQIHFIGIGFRSVFFLGRRERYRPIEVKCKRSKRQTSNNPTHTLYSCILNELTDRYWLPRLAIKRGAVFRVPGMYETIPS